MLVKTSTVPLIQTTTNGKDTSLLMNVLERLANWPSSWATLKQLHAMSCDVLLQSVCHLIFDQIYSSVLHYSMFMRLLHI